MRAASKAALEKRRSELVDSISGLSSDAARAQATADEKRTALERAKAALAEVEADLSDAAEAARS